VPDDTDMPARLAGILGMDHECGVCKTVTLWRQPYDGRWFCARCGAREHLQEGTGKRSIGRQGRRRSILTIGLVVSEFLFCGVCLVFAGQ
jgi:hypothetical protein